MEKVTQEEYSKAAEIVRRYKQQQRDAYLEGLEKPCPSCGRETSNEGDCLKCGVMYLNGVHSIMLCTEKHTHSNNCYKPYASVITDK